ncbi:hypothetical protein L286_11135 [Sphingobium sp. HDIP04]|nr:hypothetical protein L286_11135 [Sphingobium sp. HDIP04]
MPTDLAKEVAAQITGGTGNVRRLVELSMVPPLAAYVGPAITADSASVAKLAELGMPPALGKELATQIAS